MFLCALGLYYKHHQLAKKLFGLSSGQYNNTNRSLPLKKSFLFLCEDLKQQFGMPIKRNLDDLLFLQRQLLLLNYLSR